MPVEPWMGNMLPSDSLPRLEPCSTTVVLMAMVDDVYKFMWTDVGVFDTSLMSRSTTSHN